MSAARRLAALLAPLCLVAALPASASTFAQVTKTCPIGGEKFEFAEQMSATSWGQLPDGMRLGTGPNPGLLPQCPKNGLVMYRDFDAATVKRLQPLVADDEYQALRQSETPHYLAWWLASRLGDEDAPWQLLAATWEAKNADPTSAQARRYAETFVAQVRAMPVANSVDSVSLRARAANALREIGDFAGAEALRAAIIIAPDMGGSDQDAIDNRKGLTDFLTRLAGPIGRSDASRAPIDMMGNHAAAERCLEPGIKREADDPPAAPLTAFEVDYCARPAMIDEIKQFNDGFDDRMSS
ncbi:hypothetical protein [Sphingomonas alpina]|uniref:HEAT repeat domain-containing protein n=1 Tax=Sphingomonas alpina TaxID=653931 RepID=A0A7H0LEE0_9SPHN|nr:hypothetical protein [Sphingomonas alpina]QNQ08043.1 hypothetical protein H3Z74_14790 [Sphingomonas alpina]